MANSFLNKIITREKKKESISSQKEKPLLKHGRVGAFQKLPMVTSAQRKARNVTPIKGITNIAKRERNRAAKQLDALMRELAVPLREYKQNFPQKRYLHPYEWSLVELTFGEGIYEEVLGRVDTLRKKLLSVGKQHVSLCAQKLSAMPVVDSETPTLCLVGAPNVGKSSLNVKKVVSQADGYQPHLIAPEQGYRRLIEGALAYFRGPAEATVEAVHNILKQLVRKSIGETQELRRFPTLQAELAAAAFEALERFREESKKSALRLVDMEASYLTVDFFRKLPQEMEKGGNPAAPTIDRYSEAHFRRIGSNVTSYIGMVSETLMNTIPKAAVHCQVREAKQSLLNHFYIQLGKKEAPQLGQLLDEDPAMMERRQQCAKRLDLYKSARDEIDSVSWTR